MSKIPADGSIDSRQEWPYVTFHVAVPVRSHETPLPTLSKVGISRASRSTIWPSVLLLCRAVIAFGINFLPASTVSRTEEDVLVLANGVCKDPVQECDFRQHICS